MSDQEPNLENLFNNSFDKELTEFWQEMEKEVEEEGPLADQTEEDNSFFNWMGAKSPNEQVSAQPASQSRNSSTNNLDETLWEAFNDMPSTAQSQRETQPNSGNLEDWFGSDSTPPDHAPHALPRLLPLYPQWEELESLIEQTVESLDSSVNIAALEALISATPQQVSAPTTSPLSPSHAKTTQKENLNPSFPGLDDLLGQVEQTLVSVGVKEPTNKDKSATVRYQVPKNKIFDQTMRVPIRQLDNLANLIGELVIQRNQMEQHQNRLRQVLETLLGQVQKLSEVGIQNTRPI